MLRIYQERELLIRIRARIDQQNSTTESEKHQSLDNSDASKRIDFDQHPVKKLTSTFTRELILVDPEAKFFMRELRIFVYQEVGGFGDTFHFRERVLPRLDGTVVSTAFPLCILTNPCLIQRCSYTSYYALATYLFWTHVADLMWLV
jgi:hypothetical protein